MCQNHDLIIKLEDKLLYNSERGKAKIKRVYRNSMSISHQMRKGVTRLINIHNKEK